MKTKQLQSSHKIDKNTDIFSNREEYSAFLVNYTLKHIYVDLFNTLYTNLGQNRETHKKLCFSKKSVKVAKEQNIRKTICHAIAKARSE